MPLMLYAYIVGYLCLGFLAAILMGFLWGWRYAPTMYDSLSAWHMAAVMLFWPAFIVGSVVVLVVLFLAFVSESIFNNFGKKS